MRLVSLKTCTVLQESSVTSRDRTFESTVYDVKKDLASCNEAEARKANTLIHRDDVVHGSTLFTSANLSKLRVQNPCFASVCVVAYAV